MSSFKISARDDKLDDCGFSRPTLPSKEVGFPFDDYQPSAVKK